MLFKRISATWIEEEKYYKYMIKILKLVIINCNENKKDDRLLEIWMNIIE